MELCKLFVKHKLEHWINWVEVVEQFITTTENSDIPPINMTNLYVDKKK